MDFFSHQEQARKRSGVLIVCYGLAVLAITLGIYAVMMVVFNYSDEGPDTAANKLAWWNPTIALWTFLLVPCVIVTGSIIKVLQLRNGGGERVARMMGGSPVKPNTQDPSERKLLNVVEEMAIASGVPVPAVFVMREEKGINAFAAGYSQRDAVIGVTRGCIETLSRDELQGVIAHEFSHIVNGDMRLNIRLMGILFGIIMITLVGRILLRTVYFSGGSRSRSSGNKKGGNPLPFIGLALIVIGYIGVFFANLIKSAISRQREFLADAAAVQFTRNPGGIASALQRISKLSLGSKVSNPHASEAGHLFFGDCSRHFVSLFATHPPLQERIERIDATGTWRTSSSKRSPAQHASSSESTAPEGDITKEIFGEESELAGVVNLAAAQALMQMMPAAVESAMQDPTQARATLYALLWDHEETFKQRQEATLNNLDPETIAHVQNLVPVLQDLDPAARLPLAERLLPALRMMEKTQYPNFSQALIELAEANEEIDLFEFAIRNMILRQLGSVFGKVDKASVRFRSLDRVQTQVKVLLSALARWGTADTNAATPCYQAGMHTLRLEDNMPSEVSLGDVEEALKALCQAAPPIKKRLIHACTVTILHDNNIDSNQYELLRAIADGLDIPMPPMQPIQQAA